MLVKYVLLAVFLAVIVSSCDSSPRQKPKESLIDTVWVPRAIAWVRPHPQDAELGGIQYADFTLLSFRAQGKCLLISSTHSLGDGDTVIVATEPGIRVDSGHYQVAPSRVIITTKNASRTFRPPTTDRRDDVRTDTLPVTGASLWYKGIEYCPYTKLGGQRVDSFWRLL
jgi:hypothetical protein